MPELPEVETATLGIKPYALNKKIKDVVVREYKLREPIPKAILDLKDVKIIKAFRRAKYIIIQLSNICKIFFLDQLIIRPSKN